MELRRVASEIRDNQRKTKTELRARSQTNLPGSQVNPYPKKSEEVVEKSNLPSHNGNFVIQPKDIKVNQDRDKEEWEITIKISRNDDFENKNKTNVKNVPMYQAVTKPVTESSTQTSVKTEEKEILPENLITTSRLSEEQQDQPIVVKWEQPPKAPVIKTSEDKAGFSTRPPLVNRFVPAETGYTGSIKRKDVLPDLPTRERPRFSSKRGNEANKFKNILSKWEDRINLLWA